jgi:hypothetical protein
MPELLNEFSNKGEVVPQLSLGEGYSRKIYQKDLAPEGCCNGYGSQIATRRGGLADGSIMCRKSVEPRSISDRVKTILFQIKSRRYD